LSEDFIVLKSTTYQYSVNTNEIILEFDYRQTIENLTTNVSLSLKKNTRPRLLLSNMSEYQSTSITSASSTLSPEIFSIPDTVFLEFEIHGKNELLKFDEESLLTAYKSLSIGYLIVTIIIVSLFIAGCYFHKMIGL
jgi:hypothetical protein